MVVISLSCVRVTAFQGKWRTASTRIIKDNKQYNFNINSYMSVKYMFDFFFFAGKSFHHKRCIDQMGECWEEQYTQKLLKSSFVVVCFIVFLCDAYRKRSVVRRLARLRPCCYTVRSLLLRRWTLTFPHSPTAGTIQWYHTIKLGRRKRRRRKLFAFWKFASWIKKNIFLDLHVQIRYYLLSADHCFFCFVF